jgi:glycosyltransferase involved in cell wall biosynthesis
LHHMADEVFFSIIMPVYNKRPHLDRSILSVLNQTYSRFELILIDDASTDGSLQKLEEFTDPRIRIIRRTNAGPGGYAARNAGILAAHYEWICFLDADDEWKLNLLETLNRWIRKSPESDIFSWGWFIFKNNQYQLDLYSRRHIKDTNRYFSLKDFLSFPRPMWTGAVAIKKVVLVEAGMFPEGKCERGGDVDTWIRCLMISKSSLWINKTMSFYFTDSVNMVTKTVEENIPYCFYTLDTLYLATEDKALKKVIVKFRNSKLFNVITRRIKWGKGIDYNLLFMMNYKSLTFVKFFMQLHLKYIRYAFNR